MPSGPSASVTKYILISLTHCKKLAICGLYICFAYGSFENSIFLRSKQKRQCLSCSGLFLCLAGELWSNFTKNNIFGPKNTTTFLTSDTRRVTSQYGRTYFWRQSETLETQHLTNTLTSGFFRMVQFFPPAEY